MVGRIRQGEVYWVDIGPATGSAPAERHPCVVVQSDVFNQSRIATTVVCLITSNMNRAAAPGNVALRTGEGGTTKPCVVNVSQLTTVDRLELTEQMGRLSAPLLAAVLRGLHLVLTGELGG